MLAVVVRLLVLLVLLLLPQLCLNSKGLLSPLRLSAHHEHHERNLLSSFHQPSSAQSCRSPMAKLRLRGGGRSRRGQTMHQRMKNLEEMNRPITKMVMSSLPIFFHDVCDAILHSASRERKHVNGYGPTGNRLLTSQQFSM